MTWIRVTLILPLILCLSSCGDRDRPAARDGPLEPAAFWVWHRRSELSAAERESLRLAGTQHLAWQVAEGQWDGRDWQFSRVASAVPEVEGLTIVPVIRLQPSSSFLGAPASAPALAAKIQAWKGAGSELSEVQIDFDCPDRLLANYGLFLSRLSEALAPTRISATALAGWPRAAGFRALASSVSWLAPMFYDLESDDPEAVRRSEFVAMAGAGDEEWIGAWSGCPCPWRAGLPNFERLSLFNEDGTLAGHLRGWSHDEVFFHPELEARLSEEGVTVYEVTTPSVLAGSNIQPGQKVVHRQPRLANLRRLEAAAEAAGATAIIYFALPGPGVQAAYGPRHLAARDAGPPRVSVSRADRRLTLKNVGPLDLPARPVNPTHLSDHGWSLVLEAEEAGIFRDASPGGFIESSTGGDLPAELAKSVTLRFSELSTDDTILTGPLLGKAGRVRWRIPALGVEGVVE